jgi:hypothetical protein
LKITRLQKGQNLKLENCSIGARLKINRLQNLSEIHLQFN